MNRSTPTVPENSKTRCSCASWSFAAANPQAPIKELVVATMMATLRVFTALIDQEALSSGPTGATMAEQTLSQQLAFLQKKLHEYVQMLPTEVVTADVPAVTH